MVQNAQTASSRPRLLKGIIGYGVGLLILAFLFASLRNSAHKLHGVALPLTPIPLLVALAAGLVASVLSAWSWAWTLRVLGANCSFRNASHVWYSSMVARYVPGTVPGIAYRIYLTSQVGVSRPVAAAATVMDWVCWLVSALLASLLTLPWWAGSAASLSMLTGGQRILLAAALPVGVALLHPRVINFLLQKASRKAGSVVLPQMTYRQTLGLLPVYLAKWPFYGLSLAVFLPAAGSLLSSTPGRLPASTGAFSLGWIVGFISPFAPGGIGVREGVIVGILHHSSPGQAILEAALLSRVTTTLAELLCWAWALVDKKWRRPTELAVSPLPVDQAEPVAEVVD